MSNETWPRIEARSFLIVCFRYIGDVLVTTPLALSIKTAYPDADIDYLVFQGTEGILTKNPYIRKVITVPRDSANIGLLRSLFQRYDVALAAYVSDRTTLAAIIAGKRTIGLTYGGNNDVWKYLFLNAHQTYNDRLHAVSNMLSLTFQMGIPAIPQVVMGYDDDDRAFARTAIPSERYIVLHPYSMKGYKYWPVKNWAVLAELIAERTGCKALFTKAPEPKDALYLERILSASPRGTLAFEAPCSLSQLAAVIKNSVAFVGIDTAVTHIAAALEVPTIALYGPTWTRYWAPWPNGCQNPSPFIDNKGIQRKGYVTVVQKEWDCVPCNKEMCAISTRNKMECLEAITPEEVFNEIQIRLRQK